MKTKISKYMKGTLFLIIGIMLLIPIIIAIPITSEYNNDNPATVSPGETKTINLLTLLGLQSDIKIKVELIDGAGVATYVGKGDYLIVPDGYAYVPVKVSIPKDAVDGTKYDITFKFTDITSSDKEGMITVTQTSTMTMPVYVKKSAEEPEKPAMNYGWYIIIAIVLIIIIIVAYFLLRSKNSNKSK